MGLTSDPLPSSPEPASLVTQYCRLTFFVGAALLGIDIALSLAGLVPEAFEPIRLGTEGTLALTAAMGVEFERPASGMSRGRKGWFLALLGLVEVALCVKTGGNTSPYFALVVCTAVVAGLALSGVRATYVAAGISAGYVLGVRFLVDERAGVSVAESLTSLGLQVAFLFVSAILAARVGRRQRTEVKTLAVQSVRDPLTALDNRRGFLQKMESELLRAERFNWPITMLMLDLDHFKKMNDVHGHAVGDQVLVEVAALLRDNVGTLDHVARVGGEEFAVAAVAAEPYHGRDLADRIVRAFRTREWSRIRPGLGATASVGVAMIDASEVAGVPAEVISRLMQRADRALYVVKQNGRDGYHVAGSEIPSHAPARL